MTRARVATLLAFAAPLAFVSACSLLTSLDGFSDGATPEAAHDDSGRDSSSSPVGDGGLADTSSLVDGGSQDADPRGQLYASAVLADRPLGYWRLEETAGTVAKDERGTHPGTYAAEPSLGEPGIAGGRAMKLPTGKLASMGVLATPAFRFPGTAPSTVELWAKAGVLKNYGALATTEIPQVAASRSGWSVIVDVDGAIHYEVWTTAGAGGQTRGYVPISTALRPGAFHHVVIAYDGASVIGYFDGVREQTIATSGAVPDQGELHWGCRSDDGFCLDDWTIDELAVYDYALADLRVKAHFDLGK